MSLPVPTGPAPEPSEQEAKEELRADGQDPTQESAWPMESEGFNEEVTSLQRPLFPFQSFPLAFL